MENSTQPQPLDTLMNHHGITNAQLVDASTEQLSFKMVQKGRKGRRLTPNVQDKILNAILKVKPTLQIRRRDLFRYDMEESVIQAIETATALSQSKKIKYPQFIDLLKQAGVTRYGVEVGPNITTFYGSAGEAHVVEGTATNLGKHGSYDQTAIHRIIKDAQKEKMDYPTFLKMIYENGVLRYEVNVFERRIVYRGDDDSYREPIPVYDPNPAPKPVEAVKPKKPVLTKAEKEKLAEKNNGEKKQAKSKIKKRKRPGIVRTTRKARMTLRKVKSKRRKR